LWFNQETSGQNQGKIMLENFERGHIPDQPKKGKVLYYATVTEKPHFDSFQRIASSSFERFFGLYTDNYTAQEDSYYVNHPTHLGHRTPGRPVGNNIITKWQLNTQAQFFDGEKGRAADNFQKDPVILEVYSLGTVVTSYTHNTREVTEMVGDPPREHRRTVEEDLKYETEFVDRVEFRLIFRGALWAQWFIEGDSMQYGASCNTGSPFYDTTIDGGWFKAGTFTTTTKSGVDPCFALLLSHVCHTEYSVGEIKRDLHIHTPNDPYHGSFMGLGGRSGTYVSPIQVNPSVSFTFKIG
jgi:hypothetical protein